MRAEIILYVSVLGNLILGSMWFYLYLSGPDTLYSEKYEERTFQYLECGISAEAVYEKLGRPLSITWGTGQEYQHRVVKDKTSPEELKALIPSNVDRYVWRYTEPATSNSDYMLRKVVFSDDRLINTVSLYVTD